MKCSLWTLTTLGLLLATFTLTTLAPTAHAADAAKKIRVLMITGDDVAPFHNWRGMADATRDVLDASGKFEVRVCEDPLILESATALKAYDVIAFLMYNRSVPDITDQAKENLLAFVRDGKGFYCQHLASASFPKWEEFGELCGRKWVMGTSGHGPRGVFPVEIVDTDHPIGKDLSNFKLFDELYSKLQGDAPIHVIVEAKSDWSGKAEPLVFTRDYGKGRSVQNAMGHDYKAIKTPAVAKLIVRSIEWAATGDAAAQE